MMFQSTTIAGVMEVSIDWHRDARGDFGRTYCRREFAAHGLMAELAQCSVSTNARRGTVRGFHLQATPHPEAKLVQCVRGRIYDVALDLRFNSPTYRRFHAVELGADDGRMLYIPKGCAHAFQCLEDDTTILYYISTFYEPASGRGVRWDDPAIGVRWPLADAAIVSERDRDFSTLADYEAQR